MKIYNKPGSKERLYEMMENINKFQIQEQTPSPETLNRVYEALEALKRGKLKISQGGTNRAVMQTIDDVSYIGINGFDENKNMYNFNFKIAGSEGDQEGVFNVEDVILERFYFKSPETNQIIELNEDDLREVNQKYGSELYDVIEGYIDVDVKPGQEFDGMSEEIDKKPLSDPYGGTRQKYQDGMGYGDEKPVNPKLRVKAPELEKFMREDNEFDKQEGDLPGEKLIKSNYNHLITDLEFKKMAEAYQNLLKMQHGKHRAKYVSQKALTGLREMITDYLNNEKNLRVGDEDVQNFFTQWVNKYSSGSVVSEEEIEVPDDFKAFKTAKKDISKSGEGPLNFDVDFDDTENPYGDQKIAEEEKPSEEEINSDDEAPALDVNDVDDDGDNLEGGVADDEDIISYDPEQILKGIEVEMEHTKDPQIALEIAMDHLEELPDYYTRLEKMEKRGEEDLEDNNMLPGVGSDEEGNPIPAVDPDFNEISKEFGWDEEEEKNKELENELLGFDMETPNASEEMDYAAQEREYADKEGYNRYEELNAKDLNELSDDEKEEFYELWLEFGK